MIVNNNNFKEALQQLKSSTLETKSVVIDVETNGLDYDINQLCGIGIGEPKYKGVMQYYPFLHSGEDRDQNLYKEHRTQLIEFLNSSINTFIGYNLKFDLHFLAQEGLACLNKTLIDVIVMVRLIEHSDIRELSLTATGNRHYGPEAVQYDLDTKHELRKNNWYKNFSEAPIDFLGEYCKEDINLTARLYQECLVKIKKTDQSNIFNLECKLTKVLLEMEMLGISIDKEYTLKIQKLLLIRLNELEREILNVSGMKKWNRDIPIASPKHDEKEFNMSSPKQIGEVFASLGIESPIKTEKGAASWNEAALVNINHRLAGLIRQYRALQKLKSTYVDRYVDKDVMRTSFCNWGTATGRLSSRDPNLQNIPRNHFRLVSPELTEEEKLRIKNKIDAMVSSKGQQLNVELSDDVLETWAFIGDESYDDRDENQISIRRLFVPRSHYSLVSFDYNQMEVRVFMSYFRNETIDALLNKDEVDFHGEAAKLAFNITENDEQFKFYRQLAKGITFGTIYGIGKNRLAEQLKTTPEEAASYKRKYFEGMVGSKKFFNDVVARVKQSKKGIKNRYNRRYHIKADFAYKGVNYLVQGTSADILSERMVEISKYLQDKRSNIVLQVHDEIICEIHESELGLIPKRIKELLEQNSLDIPLKVDMELCVKSWANKKDFKDMSFLDYSD